MHRSAAPHRHPTPLPASRRRALGLALLLALGIAGTPAPAQTTAPATGGMNHAGMHHGASAVPMTGGAATTGHMDLGPLSQRRGRAFDRAFLTLMIPHHRAAVDMARAALKAGRDPRVGAWARAVVAAQTREIAQMGALLREVGGADPALGRLSQGMAASGRVGGAKDPDVAFVQGMVPHHASAIEMANLALQYGQDPRVLTLARDIVTAQAGEMRSFRLWLRARGLN